MSPRRRKIKSLSLSPIMRRSRSNAIPATRKWRGRAISSIESPHDAGTRGLITGRKHKKRHTRPYGCTFAGCSKAFGSKNDWKRHENTRHYQIETWRCHETSSESRINQCAKLFYRREQFQAHLKDGHGINDDDLIRDKCRKYRIGRNGQSGFWCGFCKNIVTLKQKGLAAWDERFNHIDEHYSKQKQRIDQWYLPDKDFPIGDLPNAAAPDSDAQNSPLEEAGTDEEQGENGQSLDSLHRGQTVDSGETIDLRPQPIAGGGSRSRTSKQSKLWYCVSYIYR